MTAEELQKPSINKTEQTPNKQKWNRKPRPPKKYASKAKTADMAKPGSAPEQKEQPNTKPDRRYHLKNKKKVTTNRRYPADNALLQDVSGHELDLSRQLNQLPKNNATRTLNFPKVNISQAKSEIIKRIILWFEQSEKKTLILGLSGGLDSALTAGLIAEAVGRQQLRLIHFIESEQHQLDKARAELIAKILGIKLEINDCRSLIEQHCKEFKITDDEARQQLFCRGRILALQTIADRDGSLLVSSSNKTKCLLGYAACQSVSGAINPIGDLYHSQILDMAKAINVPKLIVETTELAALLPGMKQEDRLWINWKEADFYLYQMLDVKISLAYLMTLGVDEEKIKYLYNRIRQSGRIQQLIYIPQLVDAYEPVSGESV